MTPHDLNALVTEHAPFVWRVLRHLGAKESQLDDLSQEVFIVLFQRIATFEGRSSLRTFIYGICRNVARTERRQRKAQRDQAVAHVPELESPATQENSLWLRENRARLIEVVGELDDEQRMIFVLYEIEEVSMEEIADSLGAPLRTCYSRLEAARKQVQARFRRKLIVTHAPHGEVAK